MGTPDFAVNPLHALAEAGYEDTDGDGILDKDGKNLSFKVITYSYNNNCIQLADMLQAELAQIGIILVQFTGRRTINIVSRLLLRTMLIRSMLPTITANGVHLPLIIKLVKPTLFMLLK